MTDILERARSKSQYLRGSTAERMIDELVAEVERLRLTPQEAYLKIVERWLRDNRNIHFPGGAIDDLCNRIAYWSQSHDQR